MSESKSSTWLSRANKLIRTAVLAISLFLCACKEQIVHDLDEAEANRFLTKLHEGSIESDKIKQPNGKWSIAVDKSESVEAIKFLTDARMFKSSGGSSIEKTSLVSSREDQKFYFERAVSHELERTLLGMPGILEARVHLNLPNVDPILGNRLPSSKGSGSVLLVVEHDFTANTSAIAELIAGAAGIEKTGISILVSRESAAQIKPVPAQESPASAAAKTLALSKPGKAEFKWDHYWHYFALAGGVTLIFFLALLRKLRNGGTRGRSRKFEEEELYELARDFN